MSQTFLLSLGSVFLAWSLACSQEQDTSPPEVLDDAEVERDYMNIVGSTTVYAFSELVVERFVDSSGYETPLVQPTGTGGGLMMFCSGIGPYDADITYASRRIRKSEFDRCQENGIKDIVEVKIGHSALVLARSDVAPALSLSLRDIYLALAKQVPDPTGGATLVANPYQNWSDVNPALPDEAIRVFGPSAGSARHYLLGNMALEGGCSTFEWARELRREDLLEYRTACRTVREDGTYIEADEEDVLVQELVSDPGALAVLSFGVLEQNQDEIGGLVVEGIHPSFDTISDDSYPVSRPLYLYVKKAHVDVYPGIREFLGEFTTQEATGENGYLTEIGLVPLSSAEHNEYSAAAQNLSPMSR